MRLPLLVALVVAFPLAFAASPVASERYHVLVEGEVADGWLAYPTDVTPTTLLVFGHGCCGKPDQSSFVQAYGQYYGAVVVAMDYRGAGGWDVMKGHKDLIAATLDLQARFPITHTILWGISMGGETTGMAAAERPDLFDEWVDTFGVTNLVEEFATLGLYPGPWTDSNANVHSWMVDETGGTPATAPQAYLDRSPAFHTATMIGLRHAYIVHGIGDPVVPYSMSRETFAGLVAAGVPASFYTVTTGGGGVQGPWTPAGWTGAPMCLPTAGCVVPSTPIGPAAHDGRGSAPAYGIIDQLMRGVVPDNDSNAREHVVDLTAGQSLATP